MAAAGSWTSVAVAATAFCPFCPVCCTLDRQQLFCHELLPLLITGVWICDDLGEGWLQLWLQ